MPELPEVENIRVTLSPHLIGRKITDVKVYIDRMIKYPSPEDFCAGLKGVVINNILRRGKYLIITFENQKMLVVHLRLTGALIVAEEQPEYARIKFSLSDGNNLWYTDVRTLGTLHLMNFGENIVKGLGTLGPEPDKEHLSLAYFKNALKSRGASVKGVLLDQTAIAGIGNIYADEALILAGVRPDRKASSLTDSELKKLHKAVIDVIAQGIKNKGTTFRDYKDGEGNKGSNQEHLLAYGRHGQSCLKCGTIMEYKKVAGRGSSFCPNCQH